MIQYVIDNWDGILLVVTSVISVAAAVTALTPTPKDDAIVASIRKVLDALALNVGHAKNAGDQK